jgi:NitT/TauT family transport system ATP-binding protein
MSERQVRLSIEGLHKGYGAGAARKEVISDLTFDVHAGEFVCIVGPSGAGKTTLLKCLTGLHPASSGAVRLDGKVVDGPPRQMALVLQEYTRSLMPWLTVEKNVRLPLANLKIGKAEREQRITDALREVGLSDVRTSYPWQLSGGMQQRVAIARALAYRPEVLVMDEPFGALDALTRASAQRFLTEIWEQHRRTIVFVTHDIDEAIFLGDRIFVMSPRPGRLQEIVDVDIPRPRSLDDIGTPRFAELKHHVLSLILGDGGQRAA